MRVSFHVAQPPPGNKLHDLQSSNSVVANTATTAPGYKPSQPRAAVLQDEFHPWLPCKQPQCSHATRPIHNPESEI